MIRNLYHPKKEEKDSFAILKSKYKNARSSSVFCEFLENFEAKSQKTVFFESEKMVVSSPF